VTTKRRNFFIKKFVRFDDNYKNRRKGYKFLFMGIYSGQKKKIRGWNFFSWDSIMAKK
jgi:hypothetical protein